MPFDIFLKHLGPGLAYMTNISRKNNKSIAATETISPDGNELLSSGDAQPWYYSFWLHALVVAMLAILYYGNTWKNEYALDDTLVIVRNQFVHEGFAGIPDILSKDAYYSYYDQLRSSNQLSGGRYRPLSIVTFAVEQQFFGATEAGKTDSILTFGLGYDMKEHYEKRFLHEMHIRHVLNIVWYVLAVIALLYFLRYVVFRGDPIAALLSAVLFTIHPIHTEVVANVKSRDEIMSLLFICVTFIFAIKYRDNKNNKWWLAGGIVSYFFAFLSKEYAITLLVLLPLSFYLFRKESLKASIIASLPYVAVAVVYLMIRWQVIGPRSELSDNDVQINPYAFASYTEKIATEISTSLNYLKLLLFPHPLTSDYSYNQIPYKDFGNLLVWLSVIVHVLLFYGAFYFFKKRSVLCFAIVFYLLNLLMVNNFLFDIGATMGERLIFHSSVGFAIAMGYLISRYTKKIQTEKIRWVTIGAVMLTLVVLCGFKTIQRNKDWKNDTTLFFKDVNTSPNSFLINENVATMLVNSSDFEKDETKRVADLHRAIKLFTRVLSIQDNYVLGYMNRSIGYLKLSMPDSMVADLNKVKALYPIHPQLPEMYYHAGTLYKSMSEYSKAEMTLRIGLELNPGNRELINALAEVKKANTALINIKDTVTSSNVRRND